MAVMAVRIPFIQVDLVPGSVDYAPLDPFPSDSGAECVFLGRTRAESHPAHGRLIRLSYEAYDAMARSMLQELARSAIERWGCTAIRLLHSVGDVPPGAASVLIQVATAHRSNAFEACRFLIDQLKASAPIWKREVWADGTTWSENREAGPMFAEEAR
jgi:molybdopterin synthase catalytic subunit